MRSVPKRMGPHAAGKGYQEEAIVLWVNLYRMSGPNLGIQSALFKNNWRQQYISIIYDF